MNSAEFDRGLALLVGHRLAWLPHTGATLLEHLIGTHDILKTWSIDQAILLSGLFHSAYGSRQAGHALWGERDRPMIQLAIGQKAEELTWQFSRTSLPELVAERICAHGKCAEFDFGLLHIFIANLLDQQQRVPEPFGESHKQILRSCIEHLVPTAATQLNRAIKSL